MKAILVISTILEFSLCQNFAFPATASQRIDAKPKESVWHSQPESTTKPTETISAKRENETIIEKNERIPLYAPGRCPEDQLLYPGDQESDWICDCGPGHIYHPATDRCYPAYTQGPCKKGQYLVLKKKKFIPECDQNSCSDGSVKFEGKCYELGSEDGPCPPVNEGGGVFGVNWTTLEVGCLIGTEPLSLFKVPSNCPPGSKRDSANRCRENFNI